jgi:hypothetical protein
MSECFLELIFHRSGKIGNAPAIAALLPTNSTRRYAMRKHVIGMAAAAAIIALPGIALAQAGTATGIAAGAATGAVIGGPFGAVAGGIAGGLVGSAADPHYAPGPVRTYVVEHPAPSVVYQGPVVVGTTLPETVELYQVPNYREYGYTVVNNRRVIVDPYTREVVDVVQ